MEKTKPVSMWLEMKPEKLDESFKIKLEANSLDELVRISNEAVEKAKENNLDEFFDSVVDWNLKEGGERLPCTRENKEKYLCALLSPGGEKYR